MEVVSALEPRCTLEMRDLDCHIDETEVKEALKRDVFDLGEVNIVLILKNMRGLKSGYKLS